MRILADLGTLITTAPPTVVKGIIQVEKSPEPGTAGAVPINGKYAIPVLKGVDFPVDTSSYVLDATGDVDGGDVASISMAHLLASYPMYSNLYFNPLLTAAHVNEIDFTAQFRDTFTAPPAVYMYDVRVQTGRPPLGFIIPGPAGQMPMNTAILPMNTTTTPDRPGVLISQEIDIVALMPAGADNFLVYWTLYDFAVSQDVASNGVNTPAVRSLIEPDQEPTGFNAYLSPDNGVTWCEVGLLEPVGFCNKTTKFRVAFVNRSSSKKYVASYAVLF